MNPRTRLYVLPEDLALLDALERVGSLAAAARSTGMGRDRAVYRLERLDRIAGGRVVAASRGGAQRGTSRLTPRGVALRRRARGERGPRALPREPTVASATRIEGRFHRTPFPHVRLRGGIRLAVAFRAPAGRPVRVVIPPESVLLARQRFPTSARNVLRGTVARITPARGGLARVEVAVGRARLMSLVTQRAIRALALSPRSRVVVYVKATAVRRDTGGISDPRTP